VAASRPVGLGQDSDQGMMSGKGAERGDADIPCAGEKNTHGKLVPERRWDSGGAAAPRWDTGHHHVGGINLTMPQR